jgi:hypothetical protein
MATKAKGVSKQVAIKKETTFGVLAGDTGAKLLRRTSADFNSTRESYQSAEIRTDQQVADFRLGTKSTDGSLSGELSPGSYSELIQAVLAKDFAAGGTAASVSLTISALSAGLHTLTRATGSFITDLFKVGEVIRLTGGGLNAANVGNNLLVVSVAALTMSVRPLSGTALVAEGPIATVAVASVGKESIIPLSGHTDQSFTVEEWYADIAQSEVHTGVKVGTWNVSVPATGLVTTDFTLMGKGLAQTGTSQYFTTPTALSTTGIVAAVNGAVIINGSTTTACVTAFDFSVDRAMEPSQCIGSESAEAIFTGTLTVTGNLSMYFEDAVVRDLFENETNTTLVLALATGEEKTAGVMSFVIPKAKLSSFSKSDTDMGIVATAAFTAVLNDVTSAGLPASTIQVVDTAAA